MFAGYAGLSTIKLRNAQGSESARGPGVLTLNAGNAAASTEAELTERLAGLAGRGRDSCKPDVRRAAAGIKHRNTKLHVRCPIGMAGLAADFHRPAHAVDADSILDQVRARRTILEASSQIIAYAEMCMTTAHGIEWWLENYVLFHHGCGDPTCIDIAHG